MALSQFGDKTKNWSRNEKIFSHSGLERLRVTVWREEAIVRFLIVQAERRKRRREEIQVWNLYVWNFG